MRSIVALANFSLAPSAWIIPSRTFDLVESDNKENSFQFEEIPSLNKALVLKLFSGQYLAAGENVVLMGGQGTGKTHLSIALGVQACNEGKTVRFCCLIEL